MVDDGRRTDGRTTDGRTPDHGHPISSPCEPDGSGELKIIGRFVSDLHMVGNPEDWCSRITAHLISQNNHQIFMDRLTFI